MNPKAAIRNMQQLLSKWQESSRCQNLSTWLVPGDQIGYLFKIGPPEKILVIQLKCGSCTHISV